MSLLRTLPLALLAAFSCLVLAAPGQDGQDPDKQGPDRVPDSETWPWNEIGNAEHRRLLRDMQGAWQLTTLIDPQLPEAGRRDVGYAVIADRWMSVEIHIGVNAVGGNMPLGMIRTGTHRISLGPGSKLELTSLIGSFLDRYGEIRAERPGAVRDFDVTVTSNTLRLDRPDGYSVTFSRLADSKPRRDLFGRPR